MAWHQLRAEPDSGEMGVVYLLHLSRSFGHARHYLGWASNLEARLSYHETGRGANMLKHALRAGITFELAWSAPGDRNRERQLKNRSHKDRLCEICKAAREEQRNDDGSKQLATAGTPQQG